MIDSHWALARAFDLGAACLLDAWLGDPGWLPHPVRGIGALIAGLEKFTRRCWRNERLAGAVTVGLTVLVTAGAVWLSLRLAAAAGFWVERLAAVLWLYLGLSTRCLADEAGRVRRNLAEGVRTGNLAGARRAVSRIVGRDTARLDAVEISRAAIESVAENTVDGFLSPLFYAALGGPAAMWIFKAVSTCDSMIGHRDARYVRFGTVGARSDDALNFLPARLSVWLFALAALCAGGSWRGCLRTAGRDGARHASPNAGIPEAAMAGALQVRLGGAVEYDGEAVTHGPFGGEYREPQPADVNRAVRMLWGVSLWGGGLTVAGLLALALYLEKS